jgi:hypothetical protein
MPDTIDEVAKPVVQSMTRRACCVQPHAISQILRLVNVRRLHLWHFPHRRRLAMSKGVLIAKRHAVLSRIGAGG